MDGNLATMIDFPETEATPCDHVGIGSDLDSP